MSEGYRLSGDDSILPFGLERAGIRGRVARLDATLGRILEQHRYPVPVSALVAEAVMLTALIGQAIKLRWKLSLQVRGEGPVRLIATDYFAPEREGRPAWMRAYASFDRGEVASSRAGPFTLIGDGVFGVVIDQGGDMQPYQGLTPLAGGSLGACAETYFAQSEQLATRFHLEAARAEMPGRAPEWRAGGLMVQQLTREGGRSDIVVDPDSLPADAGGKEDWNRVRILAATVEDQELVDPMLEPERLLYRLFHEEAVRAFTAHPLTFECRCSRERVEEILSRFAPEDLAEMVEEGEIRVTCEFCNRQYRFDAGEYL
jgi:molecular chaperone Hsp33